MSKLKKWLSVLLAVYMIISMVPVKAIATADDPTTLATNNDVKVWDGSVADSFERGSGTQSDPYCIATPEQLAYFSSSVNSGTTYSGQYIVLTADICLNKLSGYDKWKNSPPENKWTPIGTSSSVYFAGIFDGNGYRIQGMYVTNKTMAGLFGSVKDATIKNINISNAYVTGYYAGGAVACTYTTEFGYSVTIDNVTFDGIVTASGSCVGGIYAMYNQNTWSSCKVSNCNVFGTVTGSSSVGGIGGSAGVISNCFVNADINGSNLVGGIAGTGANINNCVVYGTVYGNTNVGGIIGYRTGGEVKGCANFAKVTGTEQVGGIIGKGWSYPTISECYNTGDVSGTKHVGGIIGYLNVGGSVTNCYNTGAVTATGSYRGGIAGECYQNGSTITQCYNIGLVNDGKGPAVCSEAWLGADVVNSYYSDGSGKGGDGTALSTSQMANKASFKGFNFESVWTVSKLAGRPVLINNPEIMADASCQVTVIDKLTGESVAGAVVAYNDHFELTNTQGSATITAPGQDYTSANCIVVKKAGYDDFICYLSDLHVSYDMVLNNTIMLNPTEGISDKDAANNIYLNEHISFYLGSFDAITNEYGFYNTVWQHEDGKRLWACYTWDIIGDVGEVLTLKFDDLTITADYYDLFVADLILSLVEVQTVDDAIFTKAADIYQDCYGNFKDNFVTNLVAIVEEDELLQEEIESLLKADNMLTVGSVKELLADKELLKSDLGKILKGEKTGVSTGMKIIYETVFGKVLTNKALFSQLFAGFSAANEIASIYTDTFDIIQDVGNACIIAESCVTVNKEIFKVLTDTAFAMENSSYALKLLDSIEKYADIATDEDAFRRYIIFEAESGLIEAAYKYAFKDILKAELYKVVSSMFNIGIPQLKALIGTYNGTYKLLDRITKLSDKNEQYFIMNYIAPVETALCEVVMDYGCRMLTNQSYESAQSFDLAYQALRFTNKYLYESAYNFAALRNDTEEMQYATHYKNAWNLNNCHDCYVIDRSKYVSIQGQGDVYLYDVNEELIVAIVNDEVIAYTDEIVTVVVCDGNKSIVFPADKEYNIKIQGTDVGAMSIDYTENSLEGFNCERVVRFDNVELDEESEFDFQMNLDKGEVSLIDQNASIILPDVDTADLVFKGAALSLHHNLAINYKVDRTLFDNAGYTDPYVVFELNGVKTTAFDYTVSGDRYVFTFNDIAPNQMNDTIHATLYATYNGVQYASETREYSVADYCYNMLAKYSTDEYAEFRTLLVDLLNYGAESQEYMDYRTDALVNDNLTEVQKAWGTSEMRTLVTVQDTQYKTIDSPSVLWKGAGLNLQKSVGMRFKIAATSIENLTVKVTNDLGQETIITSDTFEPTEGGYYVFFDGLNAGQMSDIVYLTVYEGDEVVSHTIRYSIESYAYVKQNGTDEKLAELVVAMMKYGDAAKTYIN